MKTEHDLLRQLRPTLRKIVQSLARLENPHSALRTPHSRLPTLRQLERAAIQRALTRCGGNKAAAARSLGIGRETLYQKVKRYRIVGSWRVD